MASKKTDLAIHAITTFSDQLRRTSKPDSQKLSELLSELRLAAQDERDEATQLVDSANAKTQATSLELEAAWEQVVRLRQEAEHLTREMQELKGREKQSKGRPADDGRSRASAYEQAPAMRSSELLQERLSGAHKYPPQTPTGPSAIGVSHPPQHCHAVDQRRDFVQDPRSQLPPKSAVTTPAAATSSGAQRDLATRTYDSYVPHAKRQRTDHGAARRRRAVCGACKKNGEADSCDGAAECNRCRRDGVWCAYWRCDQRSGCTKGDCTYLHPDEWDEAEEGGKRKVR